MINTIIFDLDGTLLNTLKDLYLSTNYALSEFSYPQRTVEEVRNFVGNGVAKLIERAIPDGLSNCNYEACLSVFKEHYSGQMLHNTVSYDGIINMLEVLKRRGYNIAVVSNKFDSAVKDLCNRYFKNFVDISIGESETIRKKPHPDGVLRAISEFSINREQAIYVGDSDVDVQTAHNAGLKCIGVTWGFRDYEVLKNSGADYIIQTPEGIFSILEQI